MRYCCNYIKEYIEDDGFINYFPTSRKFAIKLGKKNKWGTYINMLFCPWCGKNFPKDLSSIWFNVLREEYNISDPIIEEADKVPAEFSTDEWWRKRGL